MEMTGGQIALKTASVLIPLAISASKSCFGTCRTPDKIKKHVLVLPSKGGKSLMLHKLSSQKQYMVIDLDDYMRTLCKRDMLERLSEARRTNSTLMEAIAYTECANVVLEHVKGQIKANKSLQVLFLTSCWAWAQQRKRDAVVMACPSKEFFEEILTAEEKRIKDNHGTDAEVLTAREGLRVSRQDFLESLPADAEIAIYSSYDELEKMVRERLAIVKTL